MMPGSARERPSTHGDMTLMPGGGLQLQLRPGSPLDGEKMRQVFDAAWDFVPGRCALLVDGCGTTGLTREALEVATTGQAVEWTSALAVVVDSIVAAAVWELMVLLARPPYPIRIFRKSEPARAWIGSM